MWHFVLFSFLQLNHLCSLIRKIIATGFVILHLGITSCTLVNISYITFFNLLLFNGFMLKFDEVFVEILTFKCQIWWFWCWLFSKFLIEYLIFIVIWFCKLCTTAMNISIIIFLQWVRSTFWWKIISPLNKIYIL